MAMSIGSCKNEEALRLQRGVFLLQAMPRCVHLIANHLRCGGVAEEPRDEPSPILVSSAACGHSAAAALLLRCVALGLLQKGALVGITAEVVGAPVKFGRGRFGGDLYLHPIDGAHHLIADCCWLGRAGRVLRLMCAVMVIATPRCVHERPERATR